MAIAPILGKLGEINYWEMKKQQQFLMLQSASDGMCNPKWGYDHLIMVIQSSPMGILNIMGRGKWIDDHPQPFKMGMETAETADPEKTAMFSWWFFFDFSWDIWG